METEEFIYFSVSILLWHSTQQSDTDTNDIVGIGSDSMHQFKFCIEH